MTESLLMAHLAVLKLFGHVFKLKCLDMDEKNYIFILEWRFCFLLVLEFSGKPKGRASFYWGIRGIRLQILSSLLFFL